MKNYFFILISILLIFSACSKKQIELEPEFCGVCLSFEDTTFHKVIPITQLVYTPIIYSKNGITFKSKYKDFTTMGFVGGFSIDDNVIAGFSTGNSNYDKNIFYQGNLITEIDFAGITYSNKTLEFDINGILYASFQNPYFVNGNDKSILPTGVKYTITNLSNGTHIKITGNINTIEIHGFEVGIDNLCVSETLIDLK